MERVPQVLQFPVVVERRRTPARDLQRLEKRNLLSRDIPAQRRILQERLKARLMSAVPDDSRSTNSIVVRCSGASRRFNTISIPNVARSMFHDSISGSRHVTQLSAEMLKMSVSRNSRTMRVQLIVTAIAERRHSSQPSLILELRPGDALHHVQQFLRHEALERAERLLLEDRPHGLLRVRRALAEDQLPHVPEQRRRRVRQLSLQDVLPLAVRQRAS